MGKPYYPDWDDPDEAYPIGGPTYYPDFNDPNEAYGHAPAEDWEQIAREPFALMNELVCVRGGFINLNKTKEEFTPGAGDVLTFASSVWADSIEVYGVTRSVLPNSVRLFQGDHWQLVEDSNGHTSSISPVYRWPSTMKIVVFYNTVPDWGGL